MGGKGRGSGSEAKSPFRHLSLAGFVTGEFCVFLHSHPPWEASCAVLALHPWKDNRAALDLDSLVCNSQSAGLGWALLRLAGIGHSDLALPFETYPLLFFFLTRYDDVKRDADATVTDTAPAGAASLILSLPVQRWAFSDKCIS